MSAGGRHRAGGRLEERRTDLEESVDKVQQASTLLSKVKLPCPLCRTPTRVGEVGTFRLPGGRGGGPEEGGARRASGSKLEALIALVRGILAEGDADTKLVVFAQFSSMLAALAAALRAADIAAEVLLGPAIARHRALAEFQRPGGSPVLCLTSKHVSGLNLHHASHVIFVHPYCNPACASAEVVLLADAAAYETQAIGRIARYPNAAPCHVHRLWCRGTIEEELYRVWGFIGEEEEGLPEGLPEAAAS